MRYLCEYAATTRRDLKKHIRRKHETTLSCEKCAYISSKPSDLMKHIHSEHKDCQVEGKIKIKGTDSLPEHQIFIYLYNLMM